MAKVEPVVQPEGSEVVARAVRHESVPGPLLGDSLLPPDTLDDCKQLTPIEPVEVQAGFQAGTHPFLDVDESKLLREATPERRLARPSRARERDSSPHFPSSS